MLTLFDSKTAEAFIKRIHVLSEQTQPQWGKMNVAQMLTHCQVPLQMASGEKKANGNALIRFLFSKSAKKQLLEDPEFKRNLPTLTEAKISSQREFEKEKNKLILQIKKFSDGGPVALTKEGHPFFGEMSVSDWDTLQIKHLDHHLRQFGV